MTKKDVYYRLRRNKGTNEPWSVTSIKGYNGIKEMQFRNELLSYSLESLVKGHQKKERKKGEKLSSTNAMPYLRKRWQEKCQNPFFSFFAQPISSKLTKPKLDSNALKIIKKKCLILTQIRGHPKPKMVKISNFFLWQNDEESDTRSFIEYVLWFPILVQSPSMHYSFPCRARLGLFFRTAPKLSRWAFFLFAHHENKLSLNRIRI